MTRTDGLLNASIISMNLKPYNPYTRLRETVPRGVRHINGISGYVITCDDLRIKTLYPILNKKIGNNLFYLRQKIIFWDYAHGIKSV